MGCAAAVKAALENVEGCQEAKADWEKRWAWAKYDPHKTNPEELVKAINDNTAFEAKLPEKSELQKKGVKRGQAPFIPNRMNRE